MKRLRTNYQLDLSNQDCNSIYREKQTEIIKQQTYYNIAKKIIEDDLVRITIDDCKTNKEIINFSKEFIQFSTDFYIIDTKDVKKLFKCLNNIKITSSFDDVITNLNEIKEILYSDNC